MINGQTRVGKLILLGSVTISLFLLGIGLSGLQFETGKRLTGIFNRPDPIPLGDFRLEIPAIGVLWTVASYLFLGFLLVAVVNFITSPEARRRVLRNLLRLAAFYLAFFLLIRNRADLLGDIVEGVDRPPVTGPDSSGLVVSSGEPPAWLLPVVSMGLSMLAVGLAWFAWQRIRRRRTPLARLVEEARTALDALASGSDLQTTVVRCYSEMLRVLNENRGIRRSQAMTAREFEARLMEAGLQGDQISRLSRLFEVARYSPRIPGEQEEQEAVSCLEFIVKTYGRAS